MFREVDHGFYVDIGASDPWVDSVTRLFYDHGWTGINVEPSPAFDALNEARTRDLNLRAAVGEKEAEVPFFVAHPYSGLSSLDPSISASDPLVESVSEIAVRQCRLETILREHADGRTIHFLKVDVEGSERGVLASSDWSTFRPLVVIVEAVEPRSLMPTHEAWESILLEASYEFAAFDGLNRFYVDAEHRELVPALAYPVSVLDSYVTSASLQEKEQAGKDLAELHRKLASTRQELASTRQELESTRQQLAQAHETLGTILRSRSWRAGRMVAAAAAPAIRISRWMRRTGAPRVGLAAPLTINDATRDTARRALGLADPLVHMATFASDERTVEDARLVIGSLFWLRSWNVPVHLHVLGWQSEKSALDLAADELGVEQSVTIHGRKESSRLEEFLLGIDVAVQLRGSATAPCDVVAECLAFGVPTVATSGSVDERDAPAYLSTTGLLTSSLLVAEAIQGLCHDRRERLPVIEAERRRYLAASRALDGSVPTAPRALDLESVMSPAALPRVLVDVTQYAWSPATAGIQRVLWHLAENWEGRTVSARFGFLEGHSRGRRLRSLARAGQNGRYVTGDIADLGSVIGSTFKSGNTGLSIPPDIVQRPLRTAATETVAVDKVDDDLRWICSSRANPFPRQRQFRYRAQCANGYVLRLLRRAAANEPRALRTRLSRAPAPLPSSRHRIQQRCFHLGSNPKGLRAAACAS